MEFSPRQIEIMEASIELVGEKGIQNFTTKKLAAKIGFTEPAIYRHFGNKNVVMGHSALASCHEYNRDLQPK